MPYTNTTWTNASTPLNATNMNHLETQFAQAMTSMNMDLFPTGFVESGLVPSKDGSTATKLNITSGRAYLIQADSHNDLGLQAPGATSQTTVTINTTYNLYLQPDGTWYWSTSNSPAANSLYIATVSTDGSGNIVTVTDKRTLTVSILANGTLAPVAASLSVASTAKPSLASNVVSAGVTFGGAAGVQGDAAAASASFNGSSGYIWVPPTSLPTGNGAWTIAARFKTSTNTSAHFIGGFGGSSAKTAALLYMNAGAMVADLFSNSVTSAAATYADNNWHTAMGTWDGTTLRLYVDGAATGTPITPGANNIPANPNATIGDQYSTFHQNYWNGNLAEVAIFGTALSSARALAHHTAATAGGYAAAVAADSPVTYFRLNEPSGALYANSTVATTIASVGTDGSNALGRVASLGGLTTAGQFGAPVIVAQAVDVSVTSTSVQTILSYTPPTNGLFEVSVYFFHGNTGATACTLSVNYTDFHASLQSFPMLAYEGFAPNTNFPNFINSLSLPQNAPIPTIPMVIEAAAGGAITVKLTDASGTPSDFVTAVIKRLA